MAVDDGSHVSWILGGVTSVVAALAGVVSMLWKLNESKNATAIADLKTRVDESEEKHEECRKDREELRIEITSLRHEIRQCDDCPRRTKDS